MFVSGLVLKFQTWSKNAQRKYFQYSIISIFIRALPSAQKMREDEIVGATQNENPGKSPKKGRQKKISPQSGSESTVKRRYSTRQRVDVKNSTENKVRRKKPRKTVTKVTTTTSSESSLDPSESLPVVTTEEEIVLESVKVDKEKGDKSDLEETEQVTSTTQPGKHSLAHYNSVLAYSGDSNSGLVKTSP